MKNVFRPLADLDFAYVLNEAYADTNTGTALLNKYRSYLLHNESSCTLVNNFMNEAKNCLYDSGIVKVVNEVAAEINENKVSWQLATACEAINANKSSYNYLNRNAASSVEKLLEMEEDDVVKYIKAGALKHVMFCESIRNIVNTVFTDRQVVITEEYKATKPISYTEINECKQYFEVLGNIYSISADEGIQEAKASEVSSEFLEISRLLESSACTFDANTERMTINTPLAQYEIFVEGDCKKCKRTSNKSIEQNKEDENVKLESITFENEYELREHNRLVVGGLSYARRRNIEEQLETIAKAYENFENFALMDNVQIIEAKNDKFVIIENGDKAFAYSIASNHNTGWKVNTTIVEALDFIKRNTNVNVAKDYKANIDEQIAKTEEKRAESIKESIKRDENSARRKKIEMLTEKYKDDPATLAVLSKIAQSLNNE